MKNIFFFNSLWGLKLFRLYFSSKNDCFFTVWQRTLHIWGGGGGVVGRLHTTGSFFLVIYCHWHKVMSSNPTRRQCLSEFVVLRRKNPVWGMGSPTGIVRWRRRTPFLKMNIAFMREVPHGPGKLSSAPSALDAGIATSILYHWKFYVKNLIWNLKS